MGELGSNGDGSEVTPEQKQGPGGQAGPAPVDNKFVLVFEMDLATGQVVARGCINDMARVYQVVMMGLDSIRKHNMLNNGYLAAKYVGPPKKQSMIDFIRGRK